MSISREDLLVAVALHAGMTYAFQRSLVNDDTLNSDELDHQLSSDLRNAVEQAPRIARDLVERLNFFNPQPPSDGIGQTTNTES